MGADRKGPLAAFVVVTIIAAVLLVTSVRSQAAPGIFGRSFPVTILAGPGTAGLLHSASHHADQAVHQGMVLAHKAVEPVLSDDTATDTADASVSDAQPPSVVVHRQPQVHRLHAAPAPHRSHHGRDHHSHAGPAPVGDEHGDEHSNAPGDDSGDGPSDHSGSSIGHDEADGKGEHHGRDHSEDGDHGRYHAEDADGDSDGDGADNSDSDGDVTSARGRHLGWAKQGHHHVHGRHAYAYHAHAWR